MADLLDRLQRIARAMIASACAHIEKALLPHDRSLHPPITGAVTESDSWRLGERNFFEVPLCGFLADRVQPVLPLMFA